MAEEFAVCCVPFCAFSVCPLNDIVLLLALLSLYCTENEYFEAIFQETVKQTFKQFVLCRLSGGRHSHCLTIYGIWLCTLFDFSLNLTLWGFRDAWPIHTGWGTKCHNIDCARNTFLLLQKHLTSGTELIPKGWKIVPNEEHVQCDHRFASQPLANKPLHSSQLFDTSLQKVRGTTSLCSTAQVPHSEVVP